MEQSIKELLSLIIGAAEGGGEAALYRIGQYAVKALNKLDEQQGVGWVKASAHMPDNDMGMDWPKEYCLKCKNDSGRGSVTYTQGNYEDIENLLRTGGYDIVWWLDESPAAPKPYDDLYRLVFSNLAKLRARTQNNERMVSMADNIRSIIEDVTNKMLSMPQPERINDPWQLYQSGDDTPATLTQARADFIREVNGRDTDGVEAVVLIKYIREHYKRCKGEWTDNYGIAKLTDQGVYELFKQQKEK